MASRRVKRLDLTTPDLVVLSLLDERPAHGYEVNAELERRHVRDWAAVSRPQIYYSLEKLARAGLIRVAASDAPASGPDRRVYETTREGRSALSSALDADTWTTGRERPPFLTWMALSWRANPGVFALQLRRRRMVLRERLREAIATLRDVRKEVGHPYHEAVWMLTLTIAEIRAELRWLDRVRREARHRAPARHVER